MIAPCLRGSRGHAGIINAGNDMYKRKTRDTWQFWIDYGHGCGFEHECTEETYAEMKENRRIYREELPKGARLKIVPKRERI